MTSRAFAQIAAQVAGILAQPITESRRQSAYMVARCALLDLAMSYGTDEAAKVAYQLADELAVSRSRT